jgi:hypothetical protein
VTRIACALYCVGLGCGDDDDGDGDTHSAASSAREATDASDATDATDAIDGSVCRDDADCQSGHCDNHVCCQQGECCLLAEDCGGLGAMLTCEDTARCQGTRAAVQCEDFRCVPGAERQDDDSACGDFIEADQCGTYVAVLCSGGQQQEAPVCADSCTDDSECDRGASCVDKRCSPADDAAGTCTAGDVDGGTPCSPDCDTDADCKPDRRCRNGACEGKRGDGERCSDDGECASGHCDSGLCCEAGDCCNEPDDCPSGYTVEPTCSDPESCQGAASEADCVDHVCQARVREDDSACDADVVARTCRGMVIGCLGTEEQSDPPPCPPDCSSDDDCPEDRFCRDGDCLPDLPDGERCDGATMCTSGYCGNGYCCAGGFCCGSGADCAPIYVCSDASACDGTRLDSVCGSDSRCAVPAFAVPIKDDSACLARVARECGDYRAVLCGAGLSVEPHDCAWQCSFNWDCNLGRACHDGTCQ